MKRQLSDRDARAVVSRDDAAMVAQIREITARGNNVEIRKKGDRFSIMEVSKKSIAF